MEDMIPNSNMTVGEYIQHLRKLKLMLNKDEIIFIIDFLIELCKNT